MLHVLPAAVASAAGTLSIAGMPSKAIGSGGTVISDVASSAVPTVVVAKPTSKPSSYAAAQAAQPVNSLAGALKKAAKP